MRRVFAALAAMTLCVLASHANASRAQPSGWPKLSFARSVRPGRAVQSALFVVSYLSAESVEQHAGDGLLMIAAAHGPHSSRRHRKHIPKQESPTDPIVITEPPRTDPKPNPESEHKMETANVTMALTVAALTLASLALVYSIFILRQQRRGLEGVKLTLDAAKDIERIAGQTRRQAAETAAAERTLEDILEEKRKRLLNVPNIAFHFANEEQIKSFYNDYFKEPTVANLVSEITGESSGRIKAGLPQMLESGMGSKSIEKWISTVKLPDTSLNGMFLRYQRETIKSGQVTLGLEEVDIELSELQAFEEMIANLGTRFGLKLDKALLDSHRGHLKETAAERTLAKLEQATGFVLVEGRFKIEAEEGFYICTYLHPVNEYRSAPSVPISISVRIPKASIEVSVAGNYAASVGKLIPLKVYGQVWEPIDRATQTCRLQLTPLAIY